MRSLYGLLVLCALSGAVSAAERSPWGSVRPDAIRGHVEFLANDLLEGRAAASRGYDIAAAYVSSQFRQCGLTPGGDYVLNGSGTVLTASNQKDTNMYYDGEIGPFDLIAGSKSSGKIYTATSKQSSIAEYAPGSLIKQRTLTTKGTLVALLGVDVNGELIAMTKVQAPKTLVPTYTIERIKLQLA